MQVDCCRAPWMDACALTRVSGNLERHLLVGKCNMIPEKHTLLDAAKLSYLKKVEEGTSATHLGPDHI